MGSIHAKKQRSTISCFCTFKRWFALAILKKSFMSLICVAKPKNTIVFLFLYVSESLAMFYRDSGMNSYSTYWQWWSDEALRLSDETLNWNTLEALNASSIQFVTQHLPLHLCYFSKRESLFKASLWKEPTAAMTSLVYTGLHTRLYRGYVLTYVLTGVPYPRVCKCTRRQAERISTSSPLVFLSRLTPHRRYFLK